MDARIAQIQSILDQFRERLSISHPIEIILVDGNRKLVSVQPRDASREAFLLSIDQEFLFQLTDEELEAALAHEMGHVWIFTHHPFLHTELLANQLAMKLVDRRSLEKVYRKMFEFNGQEEQIEHFLGVSESR